MKLTFIFLSAMLAITQQQYHYPIELPWFPPQSMANNYQPFYYNNLRGGSHFIRQLWPSEPIVYYQDEEEFDLGTLEDSNEEVYPDVESRVRSRDRYKPSFLKQQDQRFLTLLSGYSVWNNLFTKTVKFTFTSTINISSVVSCIPTSLFNDPILASAICRRKRERGPNSWDESEDVQFAISPSETQQLMTTDQPSFDGIREDRQMEDLTGYYGIASSKDETNIGASKPENPRDKRFYFFLTSITITSYTFLTTTATTTAIFVYGAGLICRPSIYAIC